MYVRTAVAVSIATPSKISSARPSMLPAVRKMTPPASTLRRTAAAVPAHTAAERCLLPVLARYARMIPTISAASRPSRSVIRNDAATAASSLWVNRG